MKGAPRYRSGDAEIDQKLEEIADLAADADDADLIFEMLVSAVRLGRERYDRGSLKLINGALKELRYSLAVFSPYAGTRKVSIFGSARTKRDDAEYIAAERFGAAIAERDWMVITGAGPGIMAAGIEGAGPENSFGVGIVLPFETSAAEVIANDPKLINFRYFFTRKVTFVRESDGYVLLPGGFGTMDEGFELLTLLQTGKTYLSPVVLLDAPGGDYWPSWLEFVQKQLQTDGLISPNDLSLIRMTDDVDEAVEEICHFYRRYHSMRFVGRRLVLRLNSALSDADLARLSTDYADIMRGEIAAVEASPGEIEDHDVPDLPRIAFEFDRHGYGRLRQMINEINDAT